jgi:hypothetical protein
MDIISELNSVFPTYTTILPVSKLNVCFTPFKVKDIKNISIVLQEENKKTAFVSLISILKNNTKLTEKEINDLCMADAEYLFLQIRSKSVDELLNLVYKEEKVKINISEIKVKNNIQTKIIVVSDNIKVELKTPTLKYLNKLESFEKEEYFKACIKKITIKNEIYDFEKYVPEEIKTILENLPIKVMNEFEQFVKNEPDLSVEISLPSCPEDKKEVSGILNFFIFR